MKLKKLMHDFLQDYLDENKIEFSEWGVNVNNQEGFGDYSSNIALKLAKILKKAPIEIAENIAIHPNASESVFTLSASQPGFVNFHISNDYYLKILKQIINESENFGKKKKLNKSANVEFVSSNPTGPLTVGHGRQAILGDMVSNILTWNGYNVTREYYYNDAGKQMRVLAESCYAKYAKQVGRDVEMPENGYVGTYLDEIAEKIVNEHGKDLESDNPIFRDFTEKEIFANIENTLENLGIKFDVFTKEGTFYKNGAIDNVLKILKEKNLSYEKDGAVWFKTSSLNKEEDKVLVKSSGEPTYRLPDIAYHADKVDRGFDLIVDIFGADHIDTYPDVILGLKCMDKKTEHIKVVIHQFVTIKKGGEIVKMSTRKANFITLDELKDELSSDIIRYFFIMRGANSHLDFDLDLAKDESEKNPVYYLQYANARISNLLKRYDKEISTDSKIDYSLLKEKDEIALVKLLSEFPVKMEDVLHSLEPRKIATYLEEVAAAYHKFYGNHKVINSQNTHLSSARKKLCEATKIILTNGLSILGISAPERM
ncbi:arginine--tRNA ligase [Candidatus Marinimicrobia bacterium]|nr:arginine--tRNA ligase [Candidatus Neomarinimicrobiota bacterium]MDA9735579.1 arginine--tRNA ligase [Candidatus Neomarinimicrobiota bacterium]